MTYVPIIIVWTWVIKVILTEWIKYMRLLQETVLYPCHPLTYTAWNVHKKTAKIYSLQARGKVTKWSFTLGMTLKVAGQQHTHTHCVQKHGTTKGSSFMLQWNSIYHCCWHADFSQHSYTTSSKEDAETVITVTMGTTFVGYSTSVLVHIYLVISLDYTVSQGLE